MLIRWENLPCMMETLTVLVIAVALAMDCFAVSLAAGTVIKERRLFAAAVMGIFFGTFQSAMALIGWAAGTWIAATIGFIDHWVAFIILAINLSLQENSISKII